MELAGRRPDPAGSRPWKRIAAPILAFFAVCFALPWATWLIAWSSDDDTTTRGIAMVVALVPLTFSAVGFLGTLLRSDFGLGLTWAGAAVLGLSVISPGLMGVPYLLPALLMALAALLSMRPESSVR